MKFKLKDVDKKWHIYALAGCVVVLFAACIFNLSTVWGVISGFFKILSPVIIGFIIAYIMNPLTMVFYRKVFGKIKKKTIKWPLSVFMTIVTLLAIIALLVLSLIPNIISNVLTLVDNYEVYVDSFKNFINNQGDFISSIVVVRTFLDSLTVEGGLMTKIGDLLTANSKIIIEKTASAGSAAFNFVIGLIFAIYFLLAKRGIKAGAKRLSSLALEREKYEKMMVILDKFNAIFSRYIVFELLDAAIIGVANYIFMIIFKMQDALLISVIMALTNLVPTFGPIVGAAIGGFILLLVQPSAVIPLLIFTVVSQLIDSYLLKPNLFGNALDVPGFLILIAVIIFGKIMGIAGMLLAIPFVAILVYLYKEVLLKKLAEKRGQKTGEEVQTL